jgi:hypothetical protein
MSALEELTCGLCDDVLIIGARFPLNINDENVILVDCAESDTLNSIQFDHAFAAETACNFLISQGRRQIALIHPDARGSPTRCCSVISMRWKTISCRLIATWSLWMTPRHLWRCRYCSTMPLP